MLSSRVGCLRWVLFLAWCGLAFGGCSCSSKPRREICDELALPGCGDTCTANAQCMNGLYCTEGGTCDADCTPSGNQCRSNQFCTSQGLCQDRATDQGPTDGSNGTDFGPCIDETVNANRVVPNVIVLVDQSGSMDENFGSDACGGGSAPAGCGDSCGDNSDCASGLTCSRNDECRQSPTRWDAVRDALLGPRTSNSPLTRDTSAGLIPSLGDRINFVLSLYTSRWNDGDGDNSNDGPILECTDGVCDTTGVAPGDSNATCPQMQSYRSSDGLSTLASSYEGQTWADETPTGASVSFVTNSLAPSLPASDTFILLATDGEPDSCEFPNSNGSEGRRLSLEAVENAYTAGITTFVLGVNISGTHFQQLANVGQGLARDEPAATQATAFFADDLTGLTDTITQILRDRISCDVTLNGSLAEEDATSGSVILQTPGGDVTLIYDDADGWERVTERTLRLVGDACDTWKDGQSNLDITFPCGVIDFG